MPGSDAGSLGALLLAGMALLALIVLLVMRAGRARSGGLPSTGDGSSDATAAPEARAPSANSEGPVTTADNAVSANAGAGGTTTALRAQASSALIEADDAVHASAVEMRFAEVHLGTEAAPFSAALALARDLLAQALTAYQQAQAPAWSLHAGVEPGPEERLALAAVVDLCTRVDSLLEEAVTPFDTRRDLSGHVGDVLLALRLHSDEVTPRLETAAAGLAGLADDYPPEALAAARENMAAARTRLAFALRAIENGSTLLASGERNGAAAHARAAEAAIAQVEALLVATERVPEEQREARASIAGVLAELDRDLADAESLGVAPQVEQVHRYATQTAQWARDALASGRVDPVATLRALTESDTALEQALVPMRGAEVARQRAQSLLPAALDSASASVRSAADFISTRRGAVGGHARASLAEAHRELAEAQAQADGLVALGHAQKSDRIADQALALAHQDEARMRDELSRAGAMDGVGGANWLDGAGEMIIAGILVSAEPGVDGAWGPRSFGGTRGGRRYCRTGPS